MAFKVRNPFSAKSVDTSSPELTGREAVVQHEESEMEFRSASAPLAGGAGGPATETSNLNLSKSNREAGVPATDETDASTGALPAPSEASNLNLSKTNRGLEAPGDGTTDDGSAAARAANLNLSKSNREASGGSDEGADAEGDADDARYHAWRWNSKSAKAGETKDHGEQAAEDAGGTAAKAAKAGEKKELEEQVARDDDAERSSGPRNADRGFKTNGPEAEAGDGAGIAVSDDGGVEARQKMWHTANFREDGTDDEGASTLLDLSGDADADGVIAVGVAELDDLPDAGDLDFDVDGDSDAADSIDL